MGTKHKVGDGRTLEDQAWQTVEKVQHRVDIAEALAQRQAGAKQRIVNSKNLSHAPSPANPLTHVT